MPFRLRNGIRDPDYVAAMQVTGKSFNVRRLQDNYEFRAFQGVKQALLPLDQGIDVAVHCRDDRNLCLEPVLEHEGHFCLKGDDQIRFEALDIGLNQGCLPAALVRIPESSSKVGIKKIKKGQ